MLFHHSTSSKQCILTDNVFISNIYSGESFLRLGECMAMDPTFHGAEEWSPFLFPFLVDWSSSGFPKLVSILQWRSPPLHPCMSGQDEMLWPQHSRSSTSLTCMESGISSFSRLDVCGLWPTTTRPSRCWQLTMVCSRLAIGSGEPYIVVCWYLVYLTRISLSRQVFYEAYFVY